MHVRFAGIELRNPVIAASGTFGYGIEFEDIVSLDRIGGLVTKGLSREPMAGNPAPRLIETASGMLNSIGLQNIGVDAFLEKKLPPLASYPGCAIVTNVFGYQVKDYVAVIEALNQADGIAAYEINASCPNTKHGGQVFGTDMVELATLVYTAKQAALKRNEPRPIIIKLSPNVTSIAEMASVAERAGADALSLVNTFLGMAIDAKSRQPRIANVTAGLSGPAIKPIALRMVYEAARAVSIPILGLGGIVTAEDAVEFLLAGATAIQVGTASYADPRATERLAKALEQWCARNGVDRASSLTGALEVAPKTNPQPKGKQKLHTRYPEFEPSRSNAAPEKPARASASTAETNNPTTIW
jgi:dihydroorotate dehydrogenase (NAD+) catalytic subunit